MATLYEATFVLAEHGLVAYDNHDKSQVLIARPASIRGTDFREANEIHVIGLGDFAVKVNAPIATLTEVDKEHWNVDISRNAAPGPGPVWFNETYTTLKDAVQAVLDCYFSNKIDFENESLSEWYKPERYK